MTADSAPNPADSHTHSDNLSTDLDEEIQKINQDLLVAQFEAMKAPASGQTPKPQPTQSLQATTRMPSPNELADAEPSIPAHRDTVHSHPPPPTDHLIDKIMTDIVRHDIALTQQRLARQK